MARTYLIATWTSIALAWSAHGQPQVDPSSSVRFGQPVLVDPEADPASAPSVLPDRLPETPPPSPPTAYPSYPPAPPSVTTPPITSVPPRKKVVAWNSPAPTMTRRDDSTQHGVRNTSRWDPSITRAGHSTMDEPAPISDSGVNYFDATERRTERMWLRAEYGLWWLQGSKLPPLLTASPPGTPLQNAGVLGAPGTTVLVGDQRVPDDPISGGAFRAGFWLDPCRMWGIQGDFFFIGQQATTLSAGSDGTGIVSRPFIDALTGANAAQLVSFPGIVAGTTAVDASSDPLIGAGLMLRRTLGRGGCDIEGCDCGRGAWDVSALVGYRYLQFAEGLTILENLTALDPLNQGANIIVSDRFGTRNVFNGADLGLQMEYRKDRLSLEAAGRIALGTTYRRVAISGGTEVTVPGAGTVANTGGLYALSSNIGAYESTVFAIVPQIDVTAGYQITPRLRGTVGYSALWWTNVVRPGDQIDPVVNPNLLPPVIPGGPARPAFFGIDSTLWVQGIRAGIEIRY